VYAGLNFRVDVVKIIKGYFKWGYNGLANYSFGKDMALIGMINPLTCCIPP
jgi:hypothetical protein